MNQTNDQQIGLACGSLKGCPLWVIPLLPFAIPYALIIILKRKLFPSKENEASQAT